MNVVHFHLVINHFSVVGLFFGLMLYFLGELKNSQVITRVSYQFFVLVSLLAIAAFLSGNGAEEAVENGPNIIEGLVERHEDMAKIGMVATVLVGLFSLTGLYFQKKGKELPKTLRVVFMLSLFFSLGIMTWAANLGGQIRHDEIRPASFVSEDSSGINETDEDSSAETEKNE